MDKDITTRKAIENYFGEEFPEIKEYSNEEFENVIGIDPENYAKYLDLEDTFKIAQHFGENHINVVESISIDSGLISVKK